MNQKKENNIPGILAKTRWILPIALWGVLTFCSYQFLLKVEERSFFVYDLFWLSDFFRKPSGILSCCGAFLTQFLHIPWMGALIWVLLLTASAELTRIVFRIPRDLSILTYIPAAIFVTYNMSLGYNVYLVNLSGYFFIPVLGYLWILLTVYVFRKLPKTALIPVAIIWGFAGYYVAGFYSLAGMVIAGLDIYLSDRKNTVSILILACAAATTLLAPIVFIGTTTYNLSAGWTIGMPEQVYGLTLSRMQLPLILAVLCLLPALPGRFISKWPGSKASAIIQSIALAAVIAAPASMWFRDDNFKAELGMIHAADNLEWDKAVSILDKVSKKHEKDESWQPTRPMIMLKDLALIKTGQEGNYAFNVEEGDKSQKRELAITMSLQIGRILYLNYGLPGLCNRWCIEESVLFDWNYMTYKYLAMNAMVLDDKQLAIKYLDQMEHTLFYRKWAKQQRQLCNDRNMLAKTAPYDMILPLMCYDNTVCSDFDGCEYFLMNHFNGPSPEKSTPLYDKVALFFAMKSKQPTLFWTRLFLYLDSNNPSKIDRYYQEAAYLFGNIEHNEILEALPFDEKAKDLFKAFQQQASRVGYKKLKEAQNTFPAYLRHTYYFYYYYVNELQMF